MEEFIHKSIKEKSDKYKLMSVTKIVNSSGFGSIVIECNNQRIEITNENCKDVLEYIHKTTELVKLIEKVIAKRIYITKPKKGE